MAEKRNKPEKKQGIMETPDLFPLFEKKIPVSIMRKAVLAFLAEQSPAGAALRVPARINKYQADVAAFWTRHSAGGRNHLAGVERTVVVDIFTDRADCLPECADAAALARELRNLRLLRAEMERQIREKEPWLAVDGELFQEFRTFDYASSANSGYRKLMQKHSRLHHVLFKGSRLEHIRAAGVADYLYIAVPAGEVQPEDIADGWGLLYIWPDGGVKVVREACQQQCNTESRMHLALNIAARSLDSVLFREGVEIAPCGSKLLRPPKKRNKLLLGE